MGRKRKFDQEATLKRAMHLFWRNGYDGTSIQALLNNMGIERQSLYNGFGDKRQLYHRCLQRYERHVLAPELAILDQTGSPMAALREFFQRKLDFILDDDHAPGCFLTNCLIERFSNDIYCAVFIKRYLTTLEEYFLRALTRARKEHEIRADIDPTTLARHLLINIQGLLLLGRVTRDRGSLERTVQQVFSGLST